MGATAGRTTLNGEGLQHQDGHGLMLASTLPTCKAYDPAFSFELAVIIQKGLKEMYEEEQDLFYYITLMNENYVQPQMPDGVEEGIIKGVYKFSSTEGLKNHVNLMGSGTILNEVIAASELLKADFNISADVWSIPGINQLHRDGIEAERWNTFHSSEDQQIPYLTEALSKTNDPVVISTDYIRAYPEQIRRLIPNRLVILGTDGYGRSDMRSRLRDFFEIDRYHIVLSAVKSLYDDGQVPNSMVARVIKKYNLNSSKESPLLV